MRRFLISLLSLAGLVIPATSWEASTSSNLAITVTAGQAITGVSLSNSSFTGGAASGTVVGAISVTMSPASPAFSGSLSLSGTNASSFQIVGSNLETNGALAAGAYNVNIVATEAGTSGSPFTQAETVTGTDSATPTVQSPGPSQALYAAPYYTCVTNYYVATNGSSSNSGTSSNSPWDIVTAAGKSLAAGSCLNLATGVYLINGTLTINHGGTSANASGYVVWRCSSLALGFSSGALQGEGSGCTIRENSAGTSNLISTQAPYVIFDGVEADGNSGYAYNDCLDGGPGGNSGNNTGNGTTTYHHLWLINSDVHDCGQSGIQWNGTEYLWIVHSVIHDNSWCSNGSYSTCTGTWGSYGSGLSIYDPVGFGSGAYTSTGTIGASVPAQDNYWCATTPSSVCFHYVAAYNVVYHNYNSQTGQSNTDGEGIIFDDWSHAQNSCPGTGTCPITGAGLAMGNLLFWNGGNGIEEGNSANANQVWVVNNTAYNNNWDTHDDIPTTFRAGILNNGGGNIHVLNNVSYAVVGNSGNCSTNSGAAQLGCNVGFLDQNAENASVMQNNLGYPAGQYIGAPTTYPTTGTNPNDDGVNPSLTSLNPSSAVNNFALQPGSPVIGFGQAFSLWQQTGAIDAGACVSSLTACP
jgi:hypothetical protein